MTKCLTGLDRFRDSFPDSAWEWAWEVFISPVFGWQAYIGYACGGCAWAVGWMVANATKRQPM